MYSIAKESEQPVYPYIQIRVHCPFEEPRITDYSQSAQTVWQTWKSNCEEDRVDLIHMSLQLFNKTRYMVCHFLVHLVHKEKYICTWDTIITVNIRIPWLFTFLVINRCISLPGEQS